MRRSASWCEARGREGGSRLAVRFPDFIATSALADGDIDVKFAQIPYIGEMMKEGPLITSWSRRQGGIDAGGLFPGREGCPGPQERHDGRDPLMISNGGSFALLLLLRTWRLIGVTTTKSKGEKLRRLVLDVYENPHEFEKFVELEAAQR